MEYQTGTSLEINLGNLKKAIEYNGTDHITPELATRKYFVLCATNPKEHGLRLVEERVFDTCNYDEQIPLPKMQDLDVYLKFLKGKGISVD